MSGRNQTEPNCGIKSPNKLDKRTKHIKNENVLVIFQVVITLYKYPCVGNMRHIT